MPGSQESSRSFDNGPAAADGTADTESDLYIAGPRDSDDFDTERGPLSPFPSRRLRSARTTDERASLLDNADHYRTYQSRNISTPGTPGLGRQHSFTASIRLPRNHSRKNSVGHGFSTRLVNALIRERSNNPELGEHNRLFTECYAC